MISLSFLLYFQRSPVITSLQTTSLPIEEIPFPAITICGQGLIKDVVRSAIFEQFSRFVQEQDSTGNISTSLANMTAEEKTIAYQVCQSANETLDMCF